MQRLQTKAVLRGLRTINLKWVHSDLVSLHRLDTNLTQDVVFCVQSTLEGYIVEFASKCYQSFSKAEDIFRSRLREELLKEIPPWIKALMVDEGIMEFQKSEMET